ncbi:MAG: CHAT domain-containing protein, partial [Polymorphobacter sp.]
TIRSALISGLVELALGEGQISRVRDSIGRARPPRNGAALVLIGRRTGSVSISDTLAAMLSAAVEAQRRLLDQGLRPFEKIQIFAFMEDTAHTIWHIVNRLIETPQFKAGFTLDPEVDYRDGAGRRIGRLDDQDDWRALQIVEVQQPGGDKGLRFSSIGGSARAEGMLVSSNQDFVRKFAATIYENKSTGGWQSAARALYQLVWPAELKQARDDNRHLRLILDTAAAALPIELMDDRQDHEADQEDSKPPAVRYGMLRQLVQQDYARRQTTSSGQRTALVIGDPHDGEWHFDGFKRLPGAVKEAQHVAAQLEKAGYAVTCLIGDGNPPERIIEHLLRGGWTVLHICAHGVWDYAFQADRDAADKAPGTAVPRHTGVLLGDRIVISPAVLQAM